AISSPARRLSMINLAASTAAATKLRNEPEASSALKITSRSLSKHDLAINDRHHTTRLQNVCLGNFHDVAGENRQISQLSRLNRTAQLLFKCRVSRPQRKHLQRLLAGYRFFRMPALG